MHYLICEYNSSHSQSTGLEVKGNLKGFTGNSFNNIDKAVIEANAATVGSLTPIVSKNNTNDYVLISTGTISEAAVWKNLSIPYKVDYAFNINDELRVQAGVTIFLTSRIVVTGDSASLITEGTLEAPVKFTSAKASPAEGDWNYIRISSNASNSNSFSYTIFEYGGGDSGYGMLNIDSDVSAKIDNCTFSHSQTTGIEIDGTLNSFTGNSFNNIKEAIIEIHAATVSSLTSVTSADTPNNFVLIDSGSVSELSTWKNISVPYKIDTALNIHNELTVEAGTTILMAPGKRITVSNDGAALVFNGTADSHITIKSSKPAPGKGDWNYIRISDNASNSSIFKYTDIMHGGGDSSFGTLDIDEVELTLDHVIFSDSKDCDVEKETDTVITNIESTYTLCD